MTQTKSNRYLLTNQRTRDQSGDDLPMHDQVDILASSFSRSRRGSAPDLGNFLLPPIDDGKKNRSNNTRQFARSPAGLTERQNSNGKFFSKHPSRISSTSLSNKANLSRNSSNTSLNNTLIDKMDSLIVGRQKRSNSLTGLSSVPPELLKPRHTGNHELKPMEQNPRFSRRRRYSDTPLPRKIEMSSKSCEKDILSNNLNKPNATKVPTVANEGIVNNRTLKVRPPSTAKSDSNLTTNTLREIYDSQSDSDGESNENDTRIIEWLKDVETSILITVTNDNDDENQNNIEETAIRIIHEDT